MMNKIKLLGMTSLVLVFTLFYACSQATQTDYQVHRASVNMSKAFRQFQKADNSMVNNDQNAAVNHLSNGLDLFDKAMEHLSKAEDLVYQQAGEEIDKGNDQLQKSIDAYNGGDYDAANDHYSKALQHYDKALEILE